MKKFLTLMIFTVCICLCSCGDRTDNTIMEQICDANLNSALQAKGRTVAYRADIHCADNGIDSSYAYLDPDRVIYDCADYIEVNEKGDIYGMDYGDKTIYRYLFLDDSVKSREVEVTGYLWNPDEVVLSQSTENGNLVVRTQDGGEENLENMAGLMSYYGYDVPDTFSVMNEYILNSKTYEIQCYNVYVNFGEEDFLLIENKRIDEPEVFEIDPVLTDAVNAEDSRIVTVIADPGTDDEDIYEQSIAKGCSVMVILSLEHPSLYIDEACTQAYPGGADLNKDLTLYTIRE